MKKFEINDKCKESVKSAYKVYGDNWLDAYAEVPGKQAYGDGFHTGYTEGYVNACADVLRYLKSNKSETVDDIIKHMSL